MLSTRHALLPFSIQRLVKSSPPLIGQCCLINSDKQPPICVAESTYRLHLPSLYRFTSFSLSASDHLPPRTMNWLRSALLMCGFTWTADAQYSQLTTAMRSHCAHLLPDPASFDFVQPTWRRWSSTLRSGTSTRRPHH